MNGQRFNVPTLEPSQALRLAYGVQDGFLSGLRRSIQQGVDSLVLDRLDWLRLESRQVRKAI